LFPSDDITRGFLQAHHREKDWVPLQPDGNAQYDEQWEIDLPSLGPLVARPHSPDNVVPVEAVEGLRVHQVAIGSCTNSSYRDMMTVASMLRGKVVAPHVSLVISPGSRRVLRMIAAKGALATLIESGARILETACGPCIGMGQAPCTGGISVRTFNRNFQGRSGTPDAQVYLVSPEVAAATAIRGELTDPRKLGSPPIIPVPESFPEDDNLLVPPSPPSVAAKIALIRGPNIQPLPQKTPLPSKLTGSVLIKLGDNITTDDILPSGAKVLRLRSNIPAISEFVFESLDRTFAQRARQAGGGFIVAGKNYGQGSSREHAALGPMFLGVTAVIAHSFARIHLANLVNFGLLPLCFDDEQDYAQFNPGDTLEIEVGEFSGTTATVINKTTGERVLLHTPLNGRERSIVKRGGTLAYLKDAK
jgi:aconitate hydratase